MTTYKVAERFKSLQGEGVYAGTPMAFIRFVGCSVGKRICQHCDTDFDEVMPWRGGGEFSARDLAAWTLGYQHICFTGGEPLDQDLSDLCDELFHRAEATTIHVETSGTRDVGEFVRTVAKNARALCQPYETTWVCVSPKPGFREDAILLADEVKVIVPGLGKITPALERKLVNREPEFGKSPLQSLQEKLDEFRWPTPDDALRWARAGKIVFLQPRNAKHDIDHVNLGLVQDIIREHPELRLSVQLHKVLKVQ